MNAHVSGQVATNKIYQIATEYICLEKCKMLLEAGRRYSTVYMATTLNSER